MFIPRSRVYKLHCFSHEVAAADSLGRQPNATYFGTKGGEPNALASGVSLANGDPLSPKLALTAHKVGDIGRQPQAVCYRRSATTKSATSKLTRRVTV